MSGLLRAALVVIGLVFLISGALGMFAMSFVTSMLGTLMSTPIRGVPGLGNLQALLGPFIVFGWVFALLQFIAGVLSIAAGAALKLPKSVEKPG